MSAETAREADRGRRAAAHGPDRPLAAGLVALAAGLAVVALLGPLATGIVRYPISETLESQAIGLDAVSLFLVAPLAVVAAWLALHDRDAGAALALASGAYTSCMVAQYVLGPEYVAHDGNSERLFPLFLALFVPAWAVALRGWWRLGDAGAPTRVDRVLGRLVLPGSWGLVRGAAWRSRALYLVTGWFRLVGPAVAAMGVAMYVRDDPSASLAGAVIMGVLGVVFAAVAVEAYVPLARRPRR